ncbi:MAG: hypothetical protein K2L14_09985 [Duncaniella sp.]|nr:hypothetical protein [Duncaniella sp.]
MKHKFINFQSLFLATLCLIFTMGFTACSSDDDEPSDPIVGTWLSIFELQNCTEYYQFHFLKDGTFEGKSWATPFDPEPQNYTYTGEWITNGEYLTLTHVDEEDGVTYKESVRYEIHGDKLLIFDYDWIGPRDFYKK